MRLDELKNKKVLILGFGKEGRDSYLFLRKLFPKKVLGVADISSKFPRRRAYGSLRGRQVQSSKLFRKDKNINLHLGKDYLKAIKDYDIIIKSPGVPIHLPEVEAAFKQKKITSATEIFFENCPGIIIGITGTKGKGTTSLLIYKILKQGGVKAHLVGNIGRPVLSFLAKARKDDIFVYELSSHQLYNLKKSPHIAVFLNLYPDHLDYYRNAKEYQRAKENITRRQRKDDFFIYQGDDKIVSGIAKKTKAKKIAFGFKRGGERLISHCFLPGKHNILNIKAAISAARIFGVNNKDIRKASKTFKPLPHRLEFVGKYRGIKFYDDSASTIPAATIAAIDALKNGLETIILGGSHKGSDYKDLAKKIWQSKIKNVILFPATGEKILLEISNLCPTSHHPTSGVRYFFVKNMKEAVELSYQYTGDEKICLLSPASASFTLFRDYKQRGDLFKKYVKLKSKIKNQNANLLG